MALRMTVGSEEANRLAVAALGDFLGLPSDRNRAGFRPGSP